MADSLRVAQVLCSGAFGGIERYVATLANGLAEHGCRVTVLGGPSPRMSRELSPGVDAWRPARGVLEALVRLSKLGRLDVVHAHMTHAELAGVLALPITRGRLVVTRHFATRRGSSPQGRLAATAIRRSIDLQLACSAYVASRIDGPSVVVVPGVPVRDSSPAAAREPAVLVLQRLVPQKDTITALRAWMFSGLAEKGWTLDVVGEGGERPMLERSASELGIRQSCRFLGASGSVSTHLERASMLLASAPEEPFGLSVVEAMASGLPVVAAASAGHLENVGRCTEAVLFKPGDAGEAGRQLRELAEDVPRRADYGRALQLLQRERFGADRQIEETLAEYRALMRR